MTEVSQKLSNGKTDLYLQAAIDEVLKPSGTISVFYLRVLINLLVNADRWLEASQILEQSQ